MYKNNILIFDFDGTIHDSMRIYAPAVRACQKEYAAKGLLPDREVTDEEIRGYLGLTAAQMWQTFAPHLSEEQRKEGSEYIYREMHQLARAGKARLFDGAVSMLQELKNEGYLLVFLSNCSEAYMKLHQEVFRLERIFHEMYCAGQFDWAPKPEIVRSLIPGWKERFGAGSGQGLLRIISIGDRYTDMEIRQAVQNRNGQGERDVVIQTVFCTYGFGTPEEGTGADALAQSISQIPKAIDSCKLPFDVI